MPIPISMGLTLLDYVISPYTVLGVARIWPCLFLQKSTRLLTNNFNQNLGKALDDNLYKLSNTILRDNTRKITIPYINNFNDLELDENEYIHFYSSIVNNPYDKNHHRFTFVMGFGKKEEHYNLRSPLNNTNRNYFDTFQLCPPGC